MDASRMATKEPKYECLLFDLDDTLYPLSSGINLACRKNIQDFMLHQLQIDETDVPRMCLELYKEHGTTMAGLKVLGYEFDNDEFHACVHGTLPYHKLKPDPVLRNLLLSMPQRKIIFTNSDEAHTAEALKRLGLEDCFDGFICFETLNPSPLLAATAEAKPHSSTTRILCKPSVEAIEAAIKIADVDPQKTIFFDDSTRNIASGKLAGLHTVIVGSSVLVQGADYALSSIHNIREAIPEIWADETQQQEQVIQSTSVETLVLA
ncbi:unnamed protein product [Linum trigynum]|uniref:Uncharacterized protein n=1 Tax=Linum trigynum TaxID=586398 RepID=A0AAV2FLE2_9ROSI